MNSIRAIYFFVESGMTIFAESVITSALSPCTIVSLSTTVAVSDAGCSDSVFFDWQATASENIAATNKADLKKFFMLYIDFEWLISH